MSSFVHKEYAASVDRFGVESGTIVYFAETMAEAREVGPQSMGGVPLVGRSFGPDESRLHFLVTLNYEGQATAGGQPTNPEVNESVEGEALYIQEPMETHPSLDALLKAFNGYKDKDGKVKFNSTMKGGTSAGLGTTTKSGDANPLYGRGTYAVAGMEVLHTFVSHSLDHDVFRNMNQIIADIPSSVPARGRPPTPSGRNWMIMAPRWIFRGNVVQIFARYRLSPPGGFSKDLYALFVK